MKIGIDYRKPATLIAYANSPRKHAAKKLAKLTASVTRYGIMAPILVTPPTRSSTAMPD